MIEIERSRRKEMWETLIANGGPSGVLPQLIRELRIYGGAQGIWVDKTITHTLTYDGFGVTVGLLHTGKHYPDDLSESGIKYHYPNTDRPPLRDQGEIQSTKNANQLQLPVFVITQNSQNSLTRNVNLGWVQSWDDDEQVFNISFIREVPNNLLAQPEDNEPFDPIDELEKKIVMTKARPEQQRFSNNVFLRYGQKCAICDIEFPDLLDAAHIIPKKHGGTDDVRNGIVLCALHHRALDAGLFCFDPDTLVIRYRSDGPNEDAINIKKSDLLHLK